MNNLPTTLAVVQQQNIKLHQQPIQRSGMTTNWSCTKLFPAKEQVPRSV